MIIKSLIDEDFVNYKKPSMFIAFPYCSWKCDKECGSQVCQNSTLAHQPNIEINSEKIVQRYLKNSITSAIVMGGLEPFDTYEDLLELVSIFRRYTNDDIVIQTGYTEDELNRDYFSVGTSDLIFSLHRITNRYEELSSFKNIIIKFGRFIPNEESHYDEILGVKLVSPNQYAKEISSNK